MTDRPDPAEAATTSTMGRRAALAALGAGAAGLIAHSAAAQPQGAMTHADLGFDPKSGRYTLPPLPYAYDALEPHIDAQTMRIHHDKHHAGYVRGLNSALDALEAIRAGTGDAKLIKHWSRQVSFAGSGHVNHALFWRCMAPTGKGGGGEPSGALADAITRDFGSFQKFAGHFRAAAATVEGSGWGWLAWEPLANRLLVLQGEKQQNQNMTGVVPLLGVDVWEHAYYLLYQNRRKDYLDAFMNIINWPFVQTMYEHTMPR